jgi:hypothetical protein
MNKIRMKVTMADGQSWEVDTRTGDYVAWDSAARKHNLGTNETAQPTWEAFLGWHASKREGHTDLTWEKFLDAVDIVAGGPMPVDPTPPEPGAA